MIQIEDVIKLGPEAIASARDILVRLNEIDKPAIDQLAKTILDREADIATLDSALEFKEHSNGADVLEPEEDRLPAQPLPYSHGPLNLTPPPGYDAKNMSTHEKGLCALDQNGGKLKTKDILEVVTKFDGKYKDPKVKKNLSTVLSQNDGKTVRKVKIDGKPGYERIYK